ncbi:class I SAM-dependent methyltransferase [Sciscionella marina]|uniref:class I SAM-dependent methyltransferase n=1 Tax=Sciscionella marina TaxID=508770 RepID=UPI0003738B5D|nr:class I SAM-dependent methyltransferase [Sciscionella marina]
MIYEHPLAYLLGLEGIALLRSFGGEYGKEFTEARIAEVRKLLADERLADSAVPVERVDSNSGYRVWSRTYDAKPNTLFDFEEPIVRGFLAGREPGTALDAACGTGRYAEHLAGLGHRVIGVDSSAEMLEHARNRVPGAEFHLGSVTGIPLGDDSVDTVVCALALVHIPELEPVFAEFARVLRKGGRLIISDLHQESVFRVLVPQVRDEQGSRGRLPAHRHLTGDYLRAALAPGFRVLDCAEPRGYPEPAPEAATGLGPWELWPWSLAGLVREAASAARYGSPVTVVWHFELTG